MDDLGTYGYHAFLAVGYLAPLLLLALTVSWLRARPAFLAYYLGGWALNAVLNVALKLATREPRPAAQSRGVQLAVQYDLLPLSWEHYGMPSGHAQSCMYSWVWLAWALPLSAAVPSVMATWLTLLCLWQRHATRQHSAFQLLVGACVGWVVGMVAFRLAERQRAEPAMDAKAEDGSLVSPAHGL